ncbi:hypothetical protein RJ640_029385 [Escallonia rubra]|uniref:TIR domain-containing protein n=1 Tax=Escallonia rubra TaxID=112253 RepID=A0AA88QWD3_9ASTE|nr:hypothetical protein RJ640_029385 [Escallonia rubra]
MATTSASPFAFHVFLSFRGQDTRKTFTDHLYAALVQAGFQTFRDNESIERGKYLNSELPKAIEQSRISIVVLSKTYASSTWCLDELVTILECKKTHGNDVLPVFYDVEPSEVRKQVGSFGEAFERYENEVEEEGDLERRMELAKRLDGWKAALLQVADLTGMVLKNQADGRESKFIQKIVEVVGDKMKRTVLNDAPHLIGLDLRAKDINSWLRDESNDVGIVAICGIGGIGKTTIAKHLYNLNFERFKGSSFLASVREVSKQPDGLVRLQRQLLSDILKGKKEKIHNVDQGIVRIKEALRRIKVLVVLDDVDQVEQLDAVLGMRDWLYPGSKIIITTRRKQLLKASEFHTVHEVIKMDNIESLELFSWYAFGQDHPIEGYMHYSERVVHYCDGLPLALQVLGSSLSGKSIGVWKSALEKLKAIPEGQILKKLKLSYDSLQDDHDKNLFLDIACFFVGKDKDWTSTILDGCEFFTTIGIHNLIDRFLLRVGPGDNKLWMHHLIQDMGREIVRQESTKEPGKRSRLWHKEAFDVLSEKTLNNIRLTGGYHEFPKKLTWLCWHGFPSRTIPTDCPIQNLVALDMRYSSLKTVWKGTKLLGSLKMLDLSHSYGLVSDVLDFSLVPNLERLVLKHCINLIEVPESIGVLQRLVLLNLKGCQNLRKLPTTIHHLKSLEELILSGCSKLYDLDSTKPPTSTQTLRIAIYRMVLFQRILVA